MSKKKRPLPLEYDEEIEIREKMLPKFSDKQNNPIVFKRLPIKCKNEHQKDFIKLIDEKQIIISYGPAGTGKSHLSIAKALDLLQMGNSPYRKIHVITPAVESEEKLGYLPGSLYEKLHPYLHSTYYLIDHLIGKETREKMVNNGFIEPLAIGFLRGLNIDNSILIFEEAQNCSITSMKTLLTRIGYNSKFIITGDVEQIDNEKLKNKKESGLQYIIENLTGIDSIGIHQFTKEDIVRNSLISIILERF